MTQDQQALVRSVLAAPDDDTPRLIYADWLDDNAKAEAVEECSCRMYGRPGWVVGKTTWEPCGSCVSGKRVTPGNDFADRAKFIRYQIRLAQFVAAGYPCYHFLTAPPNCEVCQLRKETLSIQTHPPTRFQEWCAPLKLVNRLGVTLRRGFVDKVTMPTALFVGGRCGSCVDGREVCATCGGSGQVDHPSGGVNYCPNRWDDTGYFHDHCQTDACTNCDGSGGWVGVASELFLHHPVTEVVLTDRHPTAWAAGAEGGGLREWVWERSMVDQPNPHDFYTLGDGPYGDDGAAAVVPPEIFDRMTGASGGLYFVIGKNSHRRYDSAEAAYADLSASCVVWGRELAEKARLLNDRGIT